MGAAGSGDGVIAIAEFGIILQIAKGFHFLNQRKIELLGQQGNMDRAIEAGMKKSIFRIHGNTTFPK